MSAARRSARGRYRLWPVAGACAALAVAAVALAWTVTQNPKAPVAPPAAGAEVPAPEVSASRAPDAQPAVALAPLADAVHALRASDSERAALAELYGDAVVPLWLAEGTLTADARAVLDRVAGAARHGLDPSQYRVGAVADGADLRVPDAPAAAAALDAAISLAALRYMRHLHLGRIDPRALGLRLETWREPHAFPALLRDAARGGHAAAAIDALAPPFVLYARLLDALAQYRAVAALPEPPVPAFTRAVKPGEPYDGGHALGLHLAARGDLAAADVPPDGGALYEGALVAGVQRFQARHGLTPDGVLGARTVAAARVPAAARVRQIEVALERLRWVPDLGARRVVAVNIPMFQLWAWDALGPAATPAFSTRVIVGAALRTETPVFVETMDHVIFRPYWNVPSSILHGEVLPAIRRNPGYLARQQMEIVRGQGDDARPVPLGPDALEGLAAGTLRVRQRPGPHNSLGLVKFVFPNREGVYLHGTPAPALFARDRRDFSHGCIRVADPSGLARWVLTGVSGWDDTRITAAMQAEATRRVDLAAPIDVVLFYLTAAVLPEDGAVHFADDIYGHDAALERALAQRASRP